MSVEHDRQALLRGMPARRGTASKPAKEASTPLAPVRAGIRHRSSAAEVAWTDTLFGAMQALRWHPIADAPPLGPFHMGPDIGRPSGRV